MDQIGNVCRCFCHVTFIGPEPDWSCYCACGTGRKSKTQTSKEDSMQMCRCYAMQDHNAFTLEKCLCHCHSRFKVTAEHLDIPPSTNTKYRFMTLEYYNDQIVQPKFDEIKKDYDEMRQWDAARLNQAAIFERRISALEKQDNGEQLTESMDTMVRLQRLEQSRDLNYRNNTELLERIAKLEQIVEMSRDTIGTIDSTYDAVTENIMENLAELEKRHNALEEHLVSLENRAQQANRWLRKDFDRIEDLEKAFTCFKQDKDSLIESIEKSAKEPSPAIHSLTERVRILESMCPSPLKETKSYYDRITELAGDIHKARGEGMRDINAVVVGVSTCGGGGSAAGGTCTIGALTFSQAVKYMNEGANARRESWPNAGFWINKETLSTEQCKDCKSTESLDWDDFIATDWKVELTK